MTTVELNGYVTVYLSTGGEDRVSFNISNVKSSATDQDVYDVVTSIVALLEYPVDEILRHEKSNLNAD
ncbi:MAG TPA: DUF1659 domain-containing protein [Caldisericia bacterium]|nr:DUF1659 domain-containing protein [Caldisericia bacterium]